MKIMENNNNNNNNKWINCHAPISRLVTRANFWTLRISLWLSQVIQVHTEVFGSTGFENRGFSGVTDIFAIPKLKFSIKKAQSKDFRE